MNNILDLSSSLDFNNNDVVKGEIEIDDVFELENNIEILVQDKTIEPTKETQTVTVDEDYDQLGTVTVNPIPDEYIIPDGTLDVDTNGDVDVTMFRTARVGVYTPPELQDKEVIPTKNEQIVRYDENYDGLNQVTVKSIPNKYVVPIGTLEINENGNKDVRNYANVDVNIDNEINLQSKSITIIENGTQNVTADEGYDGLNSVNITINVVPSFSIANCSYLFQDNRRNDVINELLPFCNGTTNCTYMFSSCTNLTVLDLSHFDTSSVTTMNSMFSSCNKLTTLDVSNFDTSSVTTMDSMFSACINLTTLDISNFNTHKVTNMYGMFDSCGKLTTLDIGNFDTSSLTNTGSMFYSCRKLKALDLSSFNTSKVTRMNNMFYNCSELETLDISNFDFTKVTSFSNMFTNCGTSTSTGLTTVYVKDEAAQNWILTKSNGRPSTWSTANVIIKEV